MSYIFIDVDGTMYDSSKKLSSAVKADITYVQKRGYEVVIATGNPVFSKMNEIMKELNIEYIICSNGAGIYNQRKQSYSLIRMILGKNINKIMAIAIKHDVFADFWNKEHIYINSVQNTEAYSELVKCVFEKIYSDVMKKYDPSKEIDAFKIEMYGSKESIKAFYDDLLELDLELKIAYMTPNHIEITRKNIDKAFAIKEFLKDREVDIKECMTIGDSENDRGMLAASDFSYAMGNATNVIKQVAKYVTKDVTENGLGLAIRDYVNKREG